MQVGLMPTERQVNGDSLQLSCLQSIAQPALGSFPALLSSCDTARLLSKMRRSSCLQEVFQQAVFGWHLGAAAVTTLLCQSLGVQRGRYQLRHHPGSYPLILQSGEGIENF